MTAFDLTVVPVQRVEQRAVDESPRPNHASRPDNESAQQTTKRKAHELRRQHKHDLVDERWLLPIKDFLCCDDIRCEYAARDNVGHDCNHDVLFDIEWTWVKGPNTTEGTKLRLG